MGGSGTDATAVRDTDRHPVRPDGGSVRLDDPGIALKAFVTVPGSARLPIPGVLGVSVEGRGEVSGSVPEWDGGVQSSQG